MIKERFHGGIRLAESKKAEFHGAGTVRDSRFKAKQKIEMRKPRFLKRDVGFLFAGQYATDITYKLHKP